LKVDPDNRDVRIALGLLYYDMRKLDLAVAEFSIVLKKILLMIRFVIYWRTLMKKRAKINWRWKNIKNFQFFRVICKLSNSRRTYP